MFRQLIFSLPILTVAGGVLAAGCDYDIAPSDLDRIEIEVALRCEDGVVRLLAPTVRPIALEIDGQAVDAANGSWPVGPGSFSVRYRIAPGAGRHIGKTALATLDAWLIRPAEREVPLRLFARPRDGFAIALPVLRQIGVPTIQSALVPFAGYTAFGPVIERWIALPGPGALDWQPTVERARLRVVRLDGALALTNDQLFGWIERAAVAVARFWRGFPVAEALLVVQPVAGRGNVVFGRVVPGGGISVMLQVGEHAGPRAVLDDWILIHELIHTASPFIPGAQWITEGLATYLEPILRARAGWLTPEAVWAEFMNGMPRGLPAMAESGLNNAGRAGIYWGGALFMLLADAELRRSSEGRRGLEDCLIAVLRQGGDATQRWSPDAFIRACDQAVGFPILTSLAARHRAAGSPIDLVALWVALGVVGDGQSARLTESPEAWLREAILWGGRDGPPSPLSPPIE